jgi:hypothetical protein
MSFNNAKLVSTEYTGNTVLPAERGREYFLIQPVDDDLTIQFGDDGGFITILNGSYYEPYIAPSTKISVVTTGSFIVVTNI